MFPDLSPGSKMICDEWCAPAASHRGDRCNAWGCPARRLPREWTAWSGGRRVQKQWSRLILFHGPLRPLTSFVISGKSLNLSESQTLCLEREEMIINLLDFYDWINGVFKAFCIVPRMWKVFPKWDRLSLLLVQINNLALRFMLILHVFG